MSYKMTLRNTLNKGCFLRSEKLKETQGVPCSPTQLRLKVWQPQGSGQDWLPQPLLPFFCLPCGPLRLPDALVAPASHPPPAWLVTCVLSTHTRHPSSLSPLMDVPVCMCVHMCVCVYVYLCVSICACILLYVCVSVSV